MVNEPDTAQQAKSNFSGAGFSAPNYVSFVPQNNSIETW